MRSFSPLMWQSFPPLCGPAEILEAAEGLHDPLKQRHNAAGEDDGRVEPCHSETSNVLIILKGQNKFPLILKDSDEIEILEHL